MKNKNYYFRYFDSHIAKLPPSLQLALKEREQDWRRGLVSTKLFLEELRACLKHKIA